METEVLEPAEMLGSLRAPLVEAKLQLITSGSEILEPKPEPELRPSALTKFPDRGLDSLQFTGLLYLL